MLFFCSNSILFSEGPFAKESEKEKVACLLMWIRTHGLEIYNEWEWANEDEQYVLSDVWDQFESHMQSKVNSFLSIPLT